MKYDLVSAIKDSLAKLNEDAKNQITLDNKYVSIIRFIQNQNLPELDGLHLRSLERYDSENNQLNAILYNDKKHTQFDLICTNQNNETKVIISNLTNTFFLEYTVLQSGFVTFNCTYAYDNDIIQIIKDSYKNQLTLYLYTNVLDDKNVTRDPCGLPINLIPDYGQIFNYDCEYKKIRMGFFSYEPGYKDETIIRDFRVACNELANYFHEKNEDYMKIHK